MGLQATITSHSDEITIINVSSRDLVERALRQQHVPEYYNGGSSQNLSGDSQPESESLLEYFKTRIQRVADGVNNPTETREICVICQAEFEHRDTWLRT